MSQSYDGNEHRERGDCGPPRDSGRVPDLDAIQTGDGQIIIHEPDQETHWLQSDTTVEVTQ